MELINALVLILGGILAVSSLIVAKKPDAKELIDKLVPFQAGIGIAMLALGVINLVRRLDHLADIVKLVPLFGISFLAMVAASILLGFMFGMPQIAKWLPGDSGAEQKGIELSKKLVPYQVIIGLVGLVAALLMVLYRFGIL